MPLSREILLLIHHHEQHINQARKFVTFGRNNNSLSLYSKKPFFHFLIRFLKGSPCRWCLAKVKKGTYWHIYRFSRIFYECLWVAHLYPASTHSKHSKCPLQAAPRCRNWIKFSKRIELWKTNFLSSCFAESLFGCWIDISLSLFCLWDNFLIL